MFWQIEGRFAFLPGGGGVPRGEFSAGKILYFNSLRILACVSHRRTRLGFFPWQNYH